MDLPHSPRCVPLAETVAFGDNELPVLCDRRLDPVAPAVGGVFQVGDHIFRSIVGGIGIEQR